MKIKSKVQTNSMKLLKKPLSKNLKRVVDVKKNLKVAAQSQNSVQVSDKIKKQLVDGLNVTTISFKNKKSEPKNVIKEKTQSPKSNKKKTPRKVAGDSNVDSVSSIKKSKAVGNPTPLKKVKKQSTSESNNSLGISSSAVDQTIKVLLQCHKDVIEKNKLLLLKDSSGVFLQINLLKVPDIDHPRRKYLKLHHTVYGSEPDVCLFVQNVKKVTNDAKNRFTETPDDIIESFVDHYENMLKTQEIDCISAVIPVYQMITEYDSYELKRRLVDKFDLFLIQSSLLQNFQFMREIGVAFNRKNKVPLPIKFPKNLELPNPEFKNTIDESLKTTWFYLRPNTNSYSVKIGNVAMTAEELRENVVHAIGQLSKEDAIPGGNANIKSLLLKTEKSKAFPIYVSLALPNSIPVPTVVSHQRKPWMVEGEVTTQIGKKVTVCSTGNVFITADDTKILSDWSDDDDEDDQKESRLSKKEKFKLKQKNLKGKGNQQNKRKHVEENDASDVGSEGDDDETSNAAEEHYLKSIGENSDDETNEEHEKVPPKAKKHKTKQSNVQRVTLKKTKAKQGKHIKNKKLKK